METIIKQQITLTENEALVINGLTINAGMIEALTDIIISDHPCKSAESISNDLLFYKLLTKEDDTKIISENTILLNMNLISLLTCADILQGSRKKINVAENPIGRGSKLKIIKR